MWVLRRRLKVFLFSLVASGFLCSVSLSAQEASKVQINPLLEVGSLDYKMAYEALQAELSVILPRTAERLNLSEQLLIEALDKLNVSESALREAKQQSSNSDAKLKTLEDNYKLDLEESRKREQEYKALQTQYANLLILLSASEASQKQLIEQSENVSKALSLSETEREKQQTRAESAEMAIPWLIGGGIVLTVAAFFIGRITK